MNHILIKLHIPTGFIALAFVLLQLLTGPRWIKWKQRIRVHRVTGVIAISVAMIHALIGVYLRYFLS